jgi:hypothetical protein
MAYPTFPFCINFDNAADFTARRLAAQYQSGIQEIERDIGNLNAVGQVWNFSRNLLTTDKDSFEAFMGERRGRPFYFQYDYGTVAFPAVAGGQILVTCIGYEIKPEGGDVWAVSAQFQQWFGFLAA